ncbi:MAG: MarR family transcriptional regulator [Chloroflexi bacterium]|nr:MarR family transcriptional regulator [Chloroflexota bacterium]
MTRNIDADDPDRQRLTDELLDALTAWTPRDRCRMLAGWQRGGFSLAHLNVVALLELHGPLPMGRLAEALDVSVASATGIVGRMEDRGLVTRQGSTSDRRVVEVHLADGAGDLFGTLQAQRREHLRDVLAHVTDTDMTALLQGVRALRAARARLDAADEP